MSVFEMRLYSILAAFSSQLELKGGPDELLLDISPRLLFLIIKTTVDAMRLQH